MGKRGGGLPRLLGSDVGRLSASRRHDQVGKGHSPSRVLHGGERSKAAARDREAEQCGRVRLDRGGARSRARGAE
jgi:hypothetical protein